MYEFSRDIYRALVPCVHAPPGVPPSRAKRHIVDSSQHAVLRLLEEPQLKDVLARKLWREVRPMIPLAVQPQARAVLVECMTLAAEEAQRRASARPQPCRAFTRRGRPCARAPVGGGYCPSHQHLRATEDVDV